MYIAGIQARHYTKFQIEQTLDMVNSYQSRMNIEARSLVRFSEENISMLQRVFDKETLEWGWRAAFCLLTKTYFARYHLQTIRQVVSRWAPESENNTRAYIENVSHLTGIAPDEPIGIPSERPHRWMLVGIAMAIQENGLIKREQSDACISSAEREDGRAKLNGTSSIDCFSMLRGWGMMES